MKKLILSGYSGDLYKNMSDMTYPLIEKYARKYNADSKLIEFINKERPVSWQKIPAIKNELDKYDLVLWIDADIVIVNHSENIFDNILEDKIQYLVQHYVDNFVVPNAGMWMLKKDMLEYLDSIWNNNKYINHSWWEQASLLELMGFKVENYRTNLINKTTLYEKTQFLEQKWNHHPHDIKGVKYPNFVHVTMYSDRLKIIENIINIFNLERV